MWELVSFVKRSKIRSEVLKALISPKTATELKKELGVHRSAASRALLEMAKKGLVKCLTPNEKVYRIYQITEKGKEVTTYL